MVRIPPLEAPFGVEVDEQLRSMMPPGVAPIALFRTFVRNMPMARAMRQWGGYELGRDLSLTVRDREIVIDRTCARCGCEYEWGVHVAFFAERAGLDRAMVRSLAHGSSGDPCWLDARDRALVDLVDELHDTSTISDDLWARLAESFDDTEMLDALMLCGWYHAVCFVANAAGTPNEDGAPTFVDAK